MEKILSLASVLQIVVLAVVTSGLGADERREFISKTVNSDVQRLFQNSRRELISQQPFSSKNNDIMDYMIGFYNTDHGLLVTLQALKPRLDSFGRTMPDVYTGELVAIVFVDRSLLWYESEAAKSTLKAQMARLIGRQTI